MSVIMLKYFTEKYLKQVGKCKQLFSQVEGTCIFTIRFSMFSMFKIIHNINLKLIPILVQSLSVSVKFSHCREKCVCWQEYSLSQEPFYHLVDLFLIGSYFLTFNYSKINFPVQIFELYPLNCHYTLSFLCHNHLLFIYSCENRCLRVTAFLWWVYLTVPCPLI